MHFSTKDISGQRFGKLKVISVTKRRDRSGRVYWRCKCDCGQIKEIAGSHLRSGHTYSCGCSKHQLRPKEVKAISGQEFGWLTTISHKTQKISKRNQIVWTCKCRCGKIKDVVAKHLYSGAIKSCGCFSVATKIAQYTHLSAYDIPIDLIRVVQMKSKVEKALRQ